MKFIAIVGTNNTKNCLSSVYRIPVIRTESRLVFTHTMPHGPYRGAGRPEAIYMIERLLDKAAPSLGLDRVELRRRNMVPASAMPYHAANAMIYDSGDFAGVLDKALALAPRAAEVHHLSGRVALAEAFLAADEITHATTRIVRDLRVHRSTRQPSAPVGPGPIQR